MPSQESIELAEAREAKILSPMFRLQMATAFLLGSPLLLMRMAFRPGWRLSTKIFIAILERDKRNPKKADLACQQHIELLFESCTAWSEVAPRLMQLQSAHRKMTYAYSFALLYLHNRRLPEAIDAAILWTTLAEKWVIENPDDARQARRLHRRISWWYLRPEQACGKDVVVVGSDDFFKISKKIMTHGYLPFQQYRDSRVAFALLRWRQSQEANGQDTALNSTKKESTPMLYLSGGFNGRLAHRLGMSDEEFDRICAEAEQIPFKETPHGEG